MSPEDFRRDMLYHAALSIGMTLLEKKLLSQKEFAQIKKLLLKQYDPYLGKLLSGNISRNAYTKRSSSQSTRATQNHVTIIVREPHGE